jgi:hypothetical protein
MSIYILSPFENSLENRGTRNTYLAQLLYNSKKNIVFLTSNFSHTHKKIYITNEINLLQEAHKWQTIVMKSGIYKKNISAKRFFVHWELAIKYANYFHQNLKQDDIIILSSIPPEILYLIQIVNQYHKAKIIVDIRDIWPDTLITHNRILKYLFSCYCNYLYQKSLVRCDKYIYVSLSFESWIARYVKKYDAYYIPLGFDEERWKSYIYQSDPSSKNINIVYIGNLNYQFPLDEFIIAIRGKVLKFYIIGIGEKESKYKMISSDNVSFLGFLPANMASKFLIQNDIGLLPINSSSKASTPNKLFDYIAADLPILCYSNNDAAKFINEHNVGWVVDQNESDIEYLLNSLTIDEIKTKKNNMKKIKNMYSKEYLYHKYLEVINSLE